MSSLCLLRRLHLHIRSAGLFTAALVSPARDRSNHITNFTLAILPRTSHIMADMYRRSWFLQEALRAELRLQRSDHLYLTLSKGHNDAFFCKLNSAFFESHASNCFDWPLGDVMCAFNSFISNDQLRKQTFEMKLQIWTAPNERTNRSFFLFAAFQHLVLILASHVLLCAE